MSRNAPQFQTRLFLEGLEDRIVPAAPDLYFQVDEVFGGQVGQVHVTGSVMDEDPATVNIAFSGVLSGQVTPDAYGFFEFNTTASGIGAVAGVATDAEELTGTFNSTFTSEVPMLDYTVMHGAQNEIIIEGFVFDENPGGRTVVFSGIANGSTTTNADGTFSTTVQVAEPGDVVATVSDIWGQESQAVTVPFVNNAPEIMSFMAMDHGDGYWTFEGFVNDESAEGLTIRLGGIPSLEGVQVTADASGWFTYSVQLGPNESGTVWAETTDWWGIDSNTAMDAVN